MSKISKKSEKHFRKSYGKRRKNLKFVSPYVKILGIFGKFKMKLLQNF